MANAAAAHVPGNRANSERNSSEKVSTNFVQPEISIYSRSLCLGDRGPSVVGTPHARNKATITIIRIIEVTTIIIIVITIMMIMTTAAQLWLRNQTNRCVYYARVCVCVCERSDAKGAHGVRCARVEFGPARTVGRSSWDGGRVVQPVRIVAVFVSAVVAIADAFIFCFVFFFLHFPSRFSFECAVVRPINFLQLLPCRCPLDLFAHY